MNFRKKNTMISRKNAKCVCFIDCFESHLRTFCRQIHQWAKIGGGGGFGNAKI